MSAQLSVATAHTNILVPLGVSAEDGKPVKLDVIRLVETRLLVNANSGGGKSWLLRRILEQTFGKLQHLVIDPEGEFHTLREKFDYVLVARQGGDTLADPRSAALLARRLLELGVSAILDIYELKAEERRRFVRLFLESLVNAPRDLWHPALIVLDEAHVYAPQTGDAESADAVKDLMTRGRKRGFCGLLATQRLSKLHKDAAAEANNVLIGRAAQDVDMQRAADLLGFSGREERYRLRTIDPGHFFAFGPAISANGVTEVEVGPVQTTHPRPGQRSAAPAPARDTVRKVLAQLADLPKEAAEELKTVQELRTKVRTLEGELHRERSGKAPVVDPEMLKAEREKAFEAGVNAARKEASQKVSKALTYLRNCADNLEHRAARVAETLNYIGDTRKSILTNVDAIATACEVIDSNVSPVLGGKPASVPTPRPAPQVQRPAPAQQRPRPSREAAPNADLTGPERRILNAIAWMESIGIDQPELTAVAFLAGYTIGGGAFNNPRGSLRTKGLVEYAGDRIALTDAGRALAEYPDATLDAASLQAKVMERLPGPERKILQVLIDAYPEEISAEECADRAGYANGGGAFNNPRGRLRTLGLIDYPRPGYLRARELLFLERASA